MKADELSHSGKIEIPDAPSVSPDPHGIGGKAYSMHKAGVESLPEGIENTVKGLPGPKGPYGPTTTLGAAVTDSRGNRKILVDLNKPGTMETEFAWIPEPGSVSEVLEEELEDNRNNKVAEWARTREEFSGDEPQRISQFKTIDGTTLSLDILALHQLLAPATEPSANPRATKLINTKGEQTGELMNPEERFKFLEDTCKIVNEVAERADLEFKAGNQDALKWGLIRISNILGLATVITHTFEDGNGRTSRVISLFARDGVDTENKEWTSNLKTLAAERPTEEGVFRIYGFIPKAKGDTKSEVWQNSIQGAAREELSLDQSGQTLYEREKFDYFTSPFRDDVLK